MKKLSKDLVESMNRLGYTTNFTESQKAYRENFVAREWLQKNAPSYPLDLVPEYSLVLGSGTVKGYLLPEYYKDHFQNYKNTPENNQLLLDWNFIALTKYKVNGILLERANSTDEAEMALKEMGTKLLHNLCLYTGSIFESNFWEKINTNKRITKTDMEMWSGQLSKYCTNIEDIKNYQNIIGQGNLNENSLRLQYHLLLEVLSLVPDYSLTTINPVLIDLYQESDLIDKIGLEEILMGFKKYNFKLTEAMYKDYYLTGDNSELVTYVKNILIENHSLPKVSLNLITETFTKELFSNDIKLDYASVRHLSDPNFEQMERVLHVINDYLKLCMVSSEVVIKKDYIKYKVVAETEKEVNNAPKEIEQLVKFGFSSFYMDNNNSIIGLDNFTELYEKWKFTMSLEEKLSNKSEKKKIKI
jgi:hypothetical protein